MAIAFVNSTGATIATAASTWSIPVQTGLTGGGALIVGIGPASSAVTVSTVTDNTTNTYQLAIERATPKPAAGASLWYVSGISSLSTRISITLSGASSGSIGVAHFTGISTANALLQTNSSAITANSTSHGAASVTPSQSSAVLVGFGRVTASSIGTITGDAAFTTWISTNTAVRTFGQYEIQAAATARTWSWTTSSNCQHATVLAAFSDTNTVIRRGWPSLTLLGVQ